MVKVNIASKIIKLAWLNYHKDPLNWEMNILAEDLRDCLVNIGLPSSARSKFAYAHIGNVSDAEPFLEEVFGWENYVVNFNSWNNRFAMNNNVWEVEEMCQKYKQYYFVVYTFAYAYGFVTKGLYKLAVNDSRRIIPANFPLKFFKYLASKGYMHAGV